MPQYTYDCPACGARFDALKRHDESARCACGATARRQSVYAISVGTREQRYNVTQFVEASQEMQHEADKAGVQVPDFIGAARRKAAALTAAGEPLRSKAAGIG
jgi:putative FmdB family regulatory protein